MPNNNFGVRRHLSRTSPGAAKCECETWEFSSGGSNSRTSLNCDSENDRAKILPLPGGEGRGEGELVSNCIVPAEGERLFRTAPLVSCLALLALLITPPLRAQILPPPPATQTMP